MKNIEDDLPLETDVSIDPSTDDATLDKLIHDADETYFAAASTGNFAAAASSLSVRLRALSVKAEREVQREKRAGLLDGVDPTSPMSEWPEELAKFWMAWMDDMLLRIAAAKEEVNYEQA